MLTSLTGAMAPLKRRTGLRHTVAAIMGCMLLLARVEAADDPITAAIASERMPGDSAEDAWRKPEEVLRFLEVAPGHDALDFYSGPGYYSELLSRIVGPSGSVILYNNELYNQAAHHELLLRLGAKRLPNAKRLNAPSNYIPLAPQSLDRVLFVLVYHDLYWKPGGSPEPLADPQKVLQLLHSALRPNGLVVVVDHIANDTPRENAVSVASRLHRIDPKIVRADFEQAGFEFVGESAALRHANDDHSGSVFSPAVRHRTDQFIYKFRRP
jgi:predicted methyltransferase